MNFLLLFCACIAVAALVVLMHLTIQRLERQNAQLYADNQVLTAAISEMYGQHFEFKPPPEKQTTQKVTERPRGPIPPPYWKSKELKTVQIGEKTVTLNG